MMDVQKEFKTYEEMLSYDGIRVFVYRELNRSYCCTYSVYTYTNKRTKIIKELKHPQRKLRKNYFLHKPHGHGAFFSI